jgi:hypothetical protein
VVTKLSERITRDVNKCQERLGEENKKIFTAERQASAGEKVPAPRADWVLAGLELIKHKGHYRTLWIQVGFLTFVQRDPGPDGQRPIMAIMFNCWVKLKI